MARTTQEQERYEQLQSELLNVMPSEDLQRLEQDCVRVAKSVRLQGLKDVAKLGALFVVAYAVISILPSAVGFMAFILCLATGWLHVFGEIAGQGFGLVFRAANVDEFSIQRWLMQSDNTATLRIWQDFRDGTRSGFQVSAEPLSQIERVRLTLMNHLEVSMMLTMVIIAAVFYYMLLKMTYLWWVAGAFMIIRFIINGCIAPKLGAFKLSPNDLCLGHSYRTIVQLLDARLTNESNRRTRQ